MANDDVHNALTSSTPAVAINDEDDLSGRSREGSYDFPAEQPLHQKLARKAHPSLRHLQSKRVSSPTDVLSPMSQKLMSDRHQALKTVRPRALLNTLCNSSNIAGNTPLSAGLVQPASNSRDGEEDEEASEDDKHDTNVEEEQNDECDNAADSPSARHTRHEASFGQ